MHNLRFMSLIALMAMLLVSYARGESMPTFSVGEKEVIASKSHREALGLKWFIDGNIGVVRQGDTIHLYGANGSSPVRVTGTRAAPISKVTPVTIESMDERFHYRAGGPVYHDPISDRLFLFYHAEIYRETPRNFYSVLGLAIQNDEDGLSFRDLGPFYMANIPSEQASRAVEVCGAPFVIKDGYFLVYARDRLAEGKPGNINLTVARASVAKVVEAGLEGRNTTWMKYHEGSFSQPALGGLSSPLERGNPSVRWMDVSYNTTLERFIMVVAANVSMTQVDLFITWSEDGLDWAPRQQLTSDPGESFYPSIIGFEENPRQSSDRFYLYYTYSPTGGWHRWEDAVIVRREIAVSTSQSAASSSAER